MKGNGNIKPENRKTHENLRNGLKKKGDKAVISKTIPGDQRRPMCFQTLFVADLQGKVKEHCFQRCWGNAECGRGPLDPVDFFLSLFLAIALCTTDLATLREMSPFTSL